MKDDKSMKKGFSEINGVLFDLDGVFYVGDDAIPGGAETIEELRKMGITCRFSTNTTTKSLTTLFRKIQQLGLPIEKSEIISAPQVAIRYLRKQNNPTCFLCVNDDLCEDFQEFAVSDTAPDFIVIGDIDDRWDYNLLNRMFRMILNGAQIIALHKGRYWHQPDGIYLDIGSFVVGLEYSTGKQAKVIGKPNPDFFHLALEDMQVPTSKALMIGDDVVSDVGGAQKAGLKGVLVKTGKYRDELVKASGVTPDAIVQSVASLPDLLKG